MKNETLDGIIKTVGFFIICLITALIGANAPGWLFLFCPVAAGVFAWFVSDKNKAWTGFAAGLGLLFALLINLFGV